LLFCRLLGWRYLRIQPTSGYPSALVVAGLLYSLPTLFEIRMSRQLSAWIYGVSLRLFITEARYGGFQACRFLINGLPFHSSDDHGAGHSRAMADQDAYQKNSLAGRGGLSSLVRVLTSQPAPCCI